MEPDNEGFLYPTVDESACIHCGICKKVCPEQNGIKSLSVKCFITLRTRDSEILASSASGGFFTPLAEYIIAQGGKICAAGFSKRFDVRHILTDNKSTLESLRGSKYVQSELGSIFQDIKRELKKGIPVLFCGTPCQVQGLKKFLMGVDVEKLITVDVVCKGVASPMLWRNYIEYHESLAQGKVTHINFRKKVRGYHSSDMQLTFDNNKVYNKSRLDYFLRSYTNEICSRPSCYECSFKGLDRCSDFTIFDAWNAEKIVTGLKDDDKGYTNVVIHTKKGEQLFEEIKSRYIWFQGDLKLAVQLDGIMINCQPIPHNDRDFFYSELHSKGIENTIDTHLHITFKDKLKEHVKTFLYKLKLLSLCKKIRSGQLTVGTKKK